MDSFSFAPTLFKLPLGKLAQHTAPTFIAGYDANNAGIFSTNMSPGVQNGYSALWLGNGNKLVVRKLL